MCDHWMPTIQLPMTVEQFQQLPRHPAFRYEYVAGQTWLTPRTKHYHAMLDLRPMAQDRLRSVLLVGEPAYGCFACYRVLDGVYEVHAAVLPEGRGEWALDFGLSAVRHGVADQLTEVTIGYPDSPLNGPGSVLITPSPGDRVRPRARSGVTVTRSGRRALRRSAISPPKPPGVCGLAAQDVINRCKLAVRSVLKR